MKISTINNLRKIAKGWETFWDYATPAAGALAMYGLGRGLGLGQAGSIALGAVGGFGGHLGRQMFKGTDPKHPESTDPDYTYSFGNGEVDDPDYTGDQYGTRAMKGVNDSDEYRAWLAEQNNAATGGQPRNTVPAQQPAKEMKRDSQKVQGTGPQGNSATPKPRQGYVQGPGQGVDLDDKFTNEAAKLAELAREAEEDRYLTELDEQAAAESGALSALPQDPWLADHDAATTNYNTAERTVLESRLNAMAESGRMPPEVAQALGKATLAGENPLNVPEIVSYLKFGVLDNPSMSMAQSWTDAINTMAQGGELDYYTKLALMHGVGADPRSIRTHLNQIIADNQPLINELSNPNTSALRKRQIQKELQREYDMFTHQIGQQLGFVYDPNRRDLDGSFRFYEDHPYTYASTAKAAKEFFAKAKQERNLEYYKPELDRALAAREVAKQKTNAAQFKSDMQDAKAKEQDKVIQQRQKQKHDEQKDYREKRDALLALKNLSNGRNPKMREQIIGAMHVEARKNPKQFIALVKDIFETDPSFFSYAPEVLGLFRELQAR